jgi:carboxyl-terminal processing protease
MSVMILRKSVSVLSACTLLASCGGGGQSGNGNTAGTTPAAPPSPTPINTTCSLRDRQDWALNELRQWYLFPELLDLSVNPAAYSNVDDYVDALVAPARAQSRDRYFTYVTSIAAENAYFSSGSSAGFGVRLSYDETTRRVFVLEAFEDAPALAAGIDRGTEVLAIGTSPTNLRSVASLFATGGDAAVADALGPSTAGLTRTMTIRANGVEREVTVSKRDYTLAPVSSRYGYKIINDNGRRVGYINLRTFIGTADEGLRTAFDAMRTQGITELIIDFRYNGGGLVSVAETMADLLNANRAPQIWSYTTFRPEKSSENESYSLRAQSQAVPVTRVAFIGTSASASASEMVINGQLPFLGAATALIGSNTYGKPVGQIARDRSACDDRLRIVAFRVENASRQGDYYTGLASKMASTCQAADDISRPLGDPAEASVRAGLDFIAGRACTPISGQSALSAANRGLLRPTKPSAAQYQLEGLF